MRRTGPAGKLPLHVAALEGRNTDIVRILLSANASLNALATMGGSPIHCAARAGRASWVKCLAEAKADVAVVDFHGRTPLHVVGLSVQDHALPEDHVAIVRTLLDANADVHAAGKEGRRCGARLSRAMGSLYRCSWMQKQTWTRRM